MYLEKEIILVSHSWSLFLKLNCRPFPRSSSLFNWTGLFHYLRVCSSQVPPLPKGVSSHPAGSRLLCQRYLLRLILGHFHPVRSLFVSEHSKMNYASFCVSLYPSSLFLPLLITICLIPASCRCGFTIFSLSLLDCVMRKTGGGQSILSLSISALTVPSTGRAMWFISKAYRDTTPEWYRPKLCGQRFHCAVSLPLSL